MKPKHSPPKIGVAKSLLLLSAILTGAYSLGIAFNAAPWLRGPSEWRWPYVIPGSVTRLWLPILLLVGYVVVIQRLDRKRPFRRREVLVALLIAGVMTPLLQLSLLYLDHPDVRSQLFLRTVSELSGGFFNVGSVVTDSGDFLTLFVEEMPGYPVHPQRHPPGLPLLFAITRQFFDRIPNLARTMSSMLRPYQCHNLPLMNLGNSAIASAVIQMLIPFWLALVVWPLYHFGRQIYDEDTALRAVLLWPLLPSVALWATRWNHLYALFCLIAFIFLHLGLTRQRETYFLLSGFVVSLASIFSLGNVVIVGFLSVYGLIWWAAQEKRPSLRWLVVASSLFSVGLSLVWFIVWLFYDLSFFGIWHEVMSTHLGLGRSYVTWLFYHLYDFFVFLGLPLFVFGLARAVMAVSEWRQQRVDILALSFFSALILLDLSGTSQGEVARVWAFLLPLALLVAARQIPDRSIVFTAVAGLLVVQVLISNTFLRPVSTGLLDPPLPPPDSLKTTTQNPIAIWIDGPILNNISVPQTAVVGQEITIQAAWGSVQQSDRPYTVFLHLLDGQGNLVTQYDDMPLAGEWPTTCWRPGDTFNEQIRLIIPAATLPGVYRAQMGFYWLPSGERLPLVHPTGRMENNIDIGMIQLTGRN